MLQTLCLFSFRRYTSLTVLGSIIDGFVTWLVQQRYSHSYIKQRIWLLSYTESTLAQRGVRQLSDVNQTDLVACRKDLQQRFPYLTGTTDALEKYLRAKGLMQPLRIKVASVSEKYVAAYARYLETLRGSAASTIQQNSYRRVHDTREHRAAIVPRRIDDSIACRCCTSENSGLDWQKGHNCSSSSNAGIWNGRGVYIEPFPFASWLVRRVPLSRPVSRLLCSNGPEEESQGRIETGVLPRKRLRGVNLWAGDHGGFVPTASFMSVRGERGQPDVPLVVSDRSGSACRVSRGTHRPAASGNDAGSPKHQFMGTAILERLGRSLTCGF